MAATKFLYLEGLDHRRSNSPNDEDTDKFDIWNTNNDNTTHHHHHHINNPISKTTVTSRKVPYKQPHRCNQKTLLPNTKRSLPINIPELSKIMVRDPYSNKVRSSYGDHAVDDDDDDDNEGDDDWLPPHEYLARIRSASLSMHEGVGRTLKGRDLSCLRNAIWKQTGFGQD